MRRLSTAALAVTLALADHGALAAQGSGGRFELGAGAGYGRVSASEPARSLDGVHYHARVGWRMSGMAAVALEVGQYALDDEDPLPSDVGVDAAGELVVHRRPKVLRTRTALLSLHVGRRAGPYLRPGLGLGSHAFAVYGPGYATPVPRFTEAERSYEAGLALGLAAGYQTRLSDAFGLAVEAIAAWSGGEDSSGARRVVGIQVVPLVSF